MDYLPLVKYIAGRIAELIDDDFLRFAPDDAIQEALRRLGEAGRGVDGPGRG